MLFNLDIHHYALIFLQKLMELHFQNLIQIEKK
jgi:hypothetical protein